VAPAVVCTKYPALSYLYALAAHLSLQAQYLDMKIYSWPILS
jgi:hypothetical protein